MYYYQYSIIQCTVSIPEHIHAALLCLLAELVDDIVWVASVAYSISTTQQHLERDVWHCFT
jgi:hypothetical protein